jgi:exopolyphosphatase / guanosine-5'-triphosphate,3'-diphosphate pyrophosphatase
MMNRVAVIDLGTNTFHLLIAEPTSETLFKEVLHEYAAVKLGEGGINDGIIRPEAYQRGIAALEQFHQFIQQHQVQQVRALATSALRNASNGQQFIDEVQSRLGITIEIITGDTEAGYIYQGVKASGCLSAVDSLVLDIGGGSVEFIIANQNSIVYKRSFEIGAARLMALFHQTDPIPADSIYDLYSYLDEKLQPALLALHQHPVHSLIGSSGAFETFAELVERAKGHEFELKEHLTYHFVKQEFLSLTQQLIYSSHIERENMSGIIPVRVDMIVVAALITRYIIDKLHIEEVIMSTYSLKEGVLADMLSK